MINNIYTRYNEKILKWSQEQGGEKYISINNLLDYLSNNLYFDYEPTIGPFPDFPTRLALWLENVDTDDEQKSLLKLVPQLFYVGREEINSLYRAAFNSMILRWLFDQEGIFFNDKDIDSKLTSAINSTWFCPITDSLRINQFYHINQITSKHQFRPDWRSLKKFGSDEKIKLYINSNGVKYLILIEDFVGTGTQVFSTLKYACQLLPDIKVLFIPLIICPPGFKKINDELIAFSNFSMIPVIKLSEDDLINDETALKESEKKALTYLITSVFSKVSCNFSVEDFNRIKKYGFQNTGCLTVMFTNTPNNSLPIIYIESDDWKALFRRHSRA